MAGKLAVQWLDKMVSIKVNLSIVDPRGPLLTSAQYQFTGKTYTPNWDMFHVVLRGPRTPIPPSW